jgi:hypothetical protein
MNGSKTSNFSNQGLICDQALLPPSQARLFILFVIGNQGYL